MKINELNIVGFGKYENKSIELDEGINIIYGENESGKTTLHSFIDGMFYGFLRPYVKSTRYTDDHEKYQPWASKRYAGVIVFSHEGTLYRIEREFSKDNPSTKVFVENTGEDITHRIDSGSRGRILQPGFHFFGFNNVVYSNTVSIRQLCTKTDDKIADELRDKLINVSTALDEDISIDNALKQLGNNLKDIGSLKAPTSIYYKTNNKLMSLKNEEEEILALKDDYDNLLDESERLGSEIEILEQKLATERLFLSKIEYNEKKNILQEAIKLQEDLKNLESDLDQLEKYKDFSEVDYNMCLSLERDIQIKENRLEDIITKISELEKNINQTSDMDLEEVHKNIEDINKDYLLFESIEEEKNRLLYGQDSTALEFLKRDLNSTKANKSKYLYGVLALGIIYIVFNIFAIIYNYPIFMPQFLIPIFIVLSQKIKKTNGLILGIEEKIKETSSEEEEKKRIVHEKEKEQISILEKYNVSSKIELRVIYENTQQDHYKVKQKLSEKKELKGKLDIEINKRKELLLEKEVLLEKFNQLLLKYNCTHITELQIGITHKRKYDEIQLTCRNKKEILEKVLGSYTVEKLEEDLNLSKLHGSSDILQDISSKASIKDKIEVLVDAISQTKLDKKGIDEKINHISPKISRLVEIKEEINRCQVMIEELNNKKEAIELAKSTIEELSKDIHNQFAPEINKKVGNVINRITNGRYSGVRIDNNLNIGVIDPQVGEMVNISNLSGGTIDQLYFSLRFGIIDSMEGDNLPLILDDCFIQYDDNRLNNILSLLVDLSKSRQVILFTCHNREMEILNNLNIKHNLITLS